MNTYIAYYRVSTKRQGESGLGIEAQKRAVDGYARNGMIVKEFFENETGTSKKTRPVLNEAIELCKKSGHKLLIAKLDRLARDVHFISSLSKTGVDFICCDNPSANKLTINLLASVAESEAEMISSRTVAGLRSIKERIIEHGYHVSRSGRKITKLGTNNLSESARMKGSKSVSEFWARNINKRLARPYALELRSKGMELTEIADELNKNGFVTATGRNWNKYSVSRIIKEKRNGSSIESSK